jgi:predicted Zn-dependent protease
LRAELLIDRATSTHLPSDVANARAATQQLVARDPHNAALWLLDAQAAQLAGDLDGAEASRAQAARLSAGRSRSGS